MGHGDNVLMALSMRGIATPSGKARSHISESFEPRPAISEIIQVGEPCSAAAQWGPL